MEDIIKQTFALPSAWTEFLHRPWSLLTYVPVHFSVLHLLFNVLWLYCFGRLMLMRESWKRLVVCIIAGGVGGGLAYLLSSLCGVVCGDYLCGASAAVLAVMAAVALLMPDMELRLLLLGNVKLKWFALVCIMLTFVGGHSTPGASMAHVGGIAAGTLYALWLKSGRTVSHATWWPTLRKKMRRQRPRDAAAVAAVAVGRLSDHERLDALLDKIRVSGYSSLTERERSELNAISARIK